MFNKLSEKLEMKKTIDSAIKELNEQQDTELENETIYGKFNEKLDRLIEKVEK